MRWVAETAWLGGEDLVRDVLIEVSNGIFEKVEPGADPGGATRLAGVVLPGLVNAHSHAFHRMLRGRTHRRGGDFWVWREQMYELSGRLTPESYERIATAVFIEMAMAGITTVGEFHYVHHQPGGVPYEDPNEMSHALIRAARAAGIRIALLDVGYLRPGFGEADSSPAQMRFSDGSAQQWLERAGSMRQEHEGSSDVRVGLAPHSVRAVGPGDLGVVAAALDDALPLHIHVSEQPAENTECLAATGLTPTGLLSEVGLLGPATTLVHATHLTDSDIDAIGRSRSHVCYCATTERDLADGMGPAGALADAGALLCVGSDSHAVVDLFEEGRGIELHDRLATGRRGVHAPSDLVTAMTGNGSTSLGFDRAALRRGAPADFIVIDVDSPRLAGFDPRDGVEQVVFAATSSDVRHVFVGGRRVVSDRAHDGWESARPHLEPVE